MTCWVSARSDTGGTINETKWTRLVVSVKLGATGSITTYLDGQPFHTHTPQSLDGRYALRPTVLFFADENGENSPLHVGMLAIWEGALAARSRDARHGRGAGAADLDPFPGSARGLNVTVNQQTATAQLRWTAAAAGFGAAGIRVFGMAPRSPNCRSPLRLTRTLCPGAARSRSLPTRCVRSAAALGTAFHPCRSRRCGIRAAARRRPHRLLSLREDTSRTAHRTAQTCRDRLGRLADIHRRRARGIGTEFDDTASPIKCSRWALLPRSPSARPRISPSRSG